MACPSPMAAYSFGGRARNMSRRDLPCLRREETVVQGDNSHGFDTGLGCRQRNTNTGWRILQPAQVTRAGRLITEQGTTARHGKGTSSPAALRAMAQVSGSGRCNISQLGVCAGRSSAGAALLQTSEVFRYDSPTTAVQSYVVPKSQRTSGCVDMSVGVGMRGDGTTSYTVLAKQGQDTTQRA